MHSFILHSNTAVVEDVNAVKQLLEGHYTSFDWDIDETGLTLFDGKSDTSVEAIPLSSIPEEIDDPELFSDLCYEKGESGFRELLSGLSPHLLSPLQVFGTCWESGETFVTSYLVLPNDPNVQIFEFSRI